MFMRGELLKNEARLYARGISAAEKENRFLPTTSRSGCAYTGPG
jgi:hypothetical protein